MVTTSSGINHTQKTNNKQQRVNTQTHRKKNRQQQTHTQNTHTQRKTLTTHNSQKNKTHQTNKKKHNEKQKKTRVTVCCNVLVNQFPPMKEKGPEAVFLLQKPAKIAKAMVLHFHIQAMVTTSSGIIPSKPL